MVGDFASQLRVSEMTIRRDLLALERKALVTRVHGGAVTREDLGGRRRAVNGRRMTHRTIGLIVPSATYYFPRFVEGAKAAAEDENVRLVLGISDYLPETERQQIARLLEIGVDGLIVTPCGLEPDRKEVYRLLAKAGVAVVIMERSLAEVPSGLRLGGVRTDHEYGAVLAVHHLVNCGRTRIGLVASPSGTTSDPVRVGYRKAMAELSPDSVPLEFPLLGAPGNNQDQRAYQKMAAECLQAGVDGLLVLPDAAAIGISNFAMDNGVDVPKDLSIVAYDDEIAALAAPALTAVSPPKFEVGAVAVRTCLEQMIQHGGVGKLPAQAQIILLPSLQERDS